MAIENQVHDSISRHLKASQLHVKRCFVQMEDDDTLVEKYARMDL